MAEKITYYALVDSHSSRERPRTVFRCVDNDAGRADEMFSRDLTWESSSLLRGAERGDTMVDFVPISADEAAEIVERIRTDGQK